MRNAVIATVILVAVVVGLALGFFSASLWQLGQLEAKLPRLVAEGIKGALKQAVSEVGQEFISDTVKAWLEQPSDTFPPKELVAAAQPTISSQEADQLAYRDKIKIHNVHIEEPSFSTPKVLGELKNVGDRNVKKVEIVIYFLDKDGQVVYEKTSYPVGPCGLFPIGRCGHILKPNYSEEFSVYLGDAPSDWAGKVTVGVSKIDFAIP